METHNMTLEEFETKIKEVNERGREATLKHQELYGKSKEDKLKAGRRFHIGGTDGECPHCKIIIEAHDEMMALQKDKLGVVGIPLDSLFAAVNITRGVFIMMKNGGEL